MPLTEQEKHERKRARMLQTAKQYTPGTYMRKVAQIYQRMIRAEAAAKPEGVVFAITAGKVAEVFRRVGQCVCVTCGKVGPWKGNAIGGGVIESGHFIASRRASVLFEPHNCHPQCKFCNQHLGGDQGNYELYIQHVYGHEEAGRLRRLKNEVKQFTRDELVDMKLDFQARLKAAEELIPNH